MAVEPEARREAHLAARPVLSAPGFGGQLLARPRPVGHPDPVGWGLLGTGGSQHTPQRHGQGKREPRESSHSKHTMKQGKRHHDPGCTKLTTAREQHGDLGRAWLAAAGAQGSASMYFSSSLSLLTNSCASLLLRPSSILSADLTAGGWRGDGTGPGQRQPRLAPPSTPPPPRPSLTLGSGPAQVQGDRLPGPRAPSHLGPRDAANAAQAQGCLPREVVGGQPIVVHDGEQHAGAPAAAGLCGHGAGGGGGGWWSPGTLLLAPDGQGREGHSQVEELVVHGVQRSALDLGPLTADQREKVRRAQLHDHKGVAQA